ncbi:MAG: xanthine dehydrogenase family protein subunit M [Gammaproteobacteria bacterium]
MKPPPFDYVRARSIDEVLDVLARHGDEARVIAGGQSLVPMMALRLSRPAVLVDLNGVSGLAGIAPHGGALRVGAMTRQVQVLADPQVERLLPGLARATSLVGHHQTRNRGTIGGSIALADPAAENPAFALALDAGIELQSSRGARTLPATGFFSSAYVTEIASDEIVAAIHYPLWGAGTTIAVDEIMRRRGDFALVGMVAALHRDGAGVIDKAGIAWFGLTSEPTRAGELERALVGRRADGLDAAELAQVAMAGIEPREDAQASAAYRRTAGINLAARVLHAALTGAQSR